MRTRENQKNSINPVKIILFFFFVELATASQLSAIDDGGSKITLRGPAKRIIAMSPGLTEVVFELHAGSALVGVDEYSNFPLAAQGITRVNSSSAANYELILSLKPDLILAWKSGNGARIISRLRDLGLSVFVVEIQRVADIPALYRRLGSLLGQTARAKKLAEKFLDEIEVIRHSFQSQPEITVFYEVWDDPLMTLSGKHMLSDAISFCGGRNIFEDMVQIAPLINIESVAAADPQVIISGHNVEGLNNWRSRWSRWAAMQAVKKQHLYMVASDSLLRQSGRLVEGIRSLCENIQKARPLG